MKKIVKVELNGLVLNYFVDVIVISRGFVVLLHYYTSAMIINV
jgi:hypothetical protein